MSESFQELLEQTLSIANVNLGNIIKAEVVAIEKDSIVVSAGLKSESYIPIDEFINQEGEIEANIGDEVEVRVESLDDGLGNTLLSHEKARFERKWQELSEAVDTKEVVKAKVLSRVKGGYIVNVDVVRAFLPFSLASVPHDDPDSLLNQVVECCVIKMDEERSNAVISRRAVHEERNMEERQALLEKIEEGAVLNGTVKNITDYGAFMDLGGIDGLLHINDVAWERITNPGDFMQVGDSFDVKIIKVNKEEGRISLGRKQLLEDPWDTLQEQFPDGSRVRGTVRKIADYGCFVEIFPNIEGLVHTSELDWTNKSVHASKVVKIGEEVDVMVLSINRERRRISLSIKQTTVNPWEAFSTIHKVNDRVKGVVKSITEFGVFLGLEGGVDGLVHVSDLDWNDADNQAIKKYSKDQEVEAVILSLRPEERRISLGIKQLEQDAFALYAGGAGKGKLVKGKITAIEGDHLRVQLREGIEGIVRKSEASQERLDNLGQHFNVDDEIEAKVLKVDRKNRLFDLSIRAKDQDQEKAAIASYSNQGDVSVKIGDLLKDQLEESKSK